MTARKKSVTRDLLRLFEVAIFFAVSVLGYGLLATTSSAGSKSRARTQVSETRNSLIPESFERALRELRRVDQVTHGTKLASEHAQHSDVISALEAPFCLEHPRMQPLPARQDGCRRHRIASNSAPLPFNLLQQNPVLLV